VRRTLILAALVAGLATAAVAHAATSGGSGPQWATVNTCAANAVGVRASLPGDGTSKHMRVRFTAQYFDSGRRAWLPVRGVSSSPWLAAGSAEYTYGQAGWTFRFAAGTNGLVRGVAQMQWLKGGRVVRSSSRVTQAGVRSDVGGSQASCRL
jgi:hypothetical protein